MPLVELHLGSAGDGRDHSRRRVHAPDGGDSVVRDRALSDRERRTRGGSQRVLAQPHWRRTGVRGLTEERDQVALDADGAAHRAMPDGSSSRSTGPCSMCSSRYATAPSSRTGGGGRAVKVDAARGEAVGQRDATGVLQAANVVSDQIACAGGGPDQASSEPRALLIGPIDEPDADRRPDAGAAQLPHRLERGHRSERTVEPTAIGDCIDVRSDDQELVALAGDFGPQVACLISLGLETGLGELRGEPFARSHPLRRPGQALGAGEPSTALRCKLVEIGNDRLRVEAYAAHVTAWRARPSVLGTKRPCPGSVLISPRS